MIDPPLFTMKRLQRIGIPPIKIIGIILTHCHSNHDAGTFQEIFISTGVEVTFYIEKLF